MQITVVVAPMEASALLLKPSPSSSSSSSIQEPCTVHPHGTIGSSYVGILCAMLGAGIMTLPSTVSATSPALAMGLLVFTGLLAYASLWCLVLVANATRAYSYECLSCLFFPPALQWTMRALILIPCFGAMVMYMILAMDMLLPFVSLSRPVLCLGFTLLCFPLCLPDSLHALRYSNTLVLCCIFYIACVLVDRAVPLPWPATTSPLSADSLAYAIPIQTFSFCCHFNYMRVYGELQHKPSMPLVTWLIVGTAAFLYAAFSLAGYVAFRGLPPHDILTGFPVSDASVSGIRLALALAMLCKMPLAYQPLRDMLEKVVGVQTCPRAKWCFRTVVTAGFLFAACGIAVTADDLSYVMDWIGATDGILVAFVVPGLFLYYATRHKAYKNALPSYALWLALAMAATGLVLAIFSVHRLV
ncbi:Aste57867_16204 [Aphanomyces stellatus]|uniref:Aste57867_16204 protein n=1 Tax=Aphanomyces stellatus TaxID=120398 RepID=A0A485L6S5_9STRA|nr:hypothetical protein As57867_016148 [Aphanomyces stellatus]VFT92982.1 Aste57867_16204 [Aphanomyces stellatus]